MRFTAIVNINLKELIEITEFVASVITIIQFYHFFKSVRIRSSQTINKFLK